MTAKHESIADFIAKLDPFTEEEQAAQLLMILCVIRGRENARYYRKETRRLLESVRDGTATDEERQYLLWAVKRMSTEREPSKNSAYGRQTYALTLKYLAPERLEAREIAQLANVDKKTVFRDIDAAVGRLAFWLFGVTALPWK